MTEEAKATDRSVVGSQQNVKEEPGEDNQRVILTNLGTILMSPLTGPISLMIRIVYFLTETVSDFRYRRRQ